MNIGVEVRPIYDPKRVPGNERTSNRIAVTEPIIDEPRRILLLRIGLLPIRRRAGLNQDRPKRIIPRLIGDGGCGVGLGDHISPAVVEVISWMATPLAILQPSNPSPVIMPPDVFDDRAAG